MRGTAWSSLHSSAYGGDQAERNSVFFFDEIPCFKQFLGDMKGRFLFFPWKFLLVGLPSY